MGSMIQRWLLSGPSMIPPFFEDEAVARPRALQLFPEHPLNLNVCRGHVVARSLLGHLKRFDLAEIANEDTAAFWAALRMMPSTGEPCVVGRTGGRAKKASG